MDGNFIEGVLSTKKRIGYVSVLFYASWCPFSQRILPEFEILSSMFPQVQHVAIEQSSAMPRFEAIPPFLYLHNYEIYFLFCMSHTYIKLQKLGSFFVQ